ncbi:starvation-inducible DNA-binding protein [Epilithonimonas bovis DSM 19482]|uniref:Starvation-inducible DNA-binding protein n=1 Tax=Epilithonimonas bovis DSM 19482 TaxID=1121284 RepID=A0A1U7PXB9_9FLAO|nr:DNA starvation/stationary phase protection protein [Epilithonimonas bovis]SIT96623.1 starvation-inducible DNA-binding protein [Epilithonimonas bovis DSM 19482]
MKAQIGLEPKKAESISEVLSSLLADEFVLYAKTRNAHWNVQGPDFHTVHLYFETLYHELETYIDDVAERIRQIGHYAPATLQEYLELTHLTEQRIEKNDSLSFIKDLLSDHEAIIIFLRENIDKIEEEYDFGTSDFLTTLMEKHEKTAWMLRSHLK